MRASSRLVAGNRVAALYAGRDGLTEAGQQVSFRVLNLLPARRILALHIFMPQSAHARRTARKGITHGPYPARIAVSP